MKIGLSYSRCVRDIVEKKVDIQDVLVIISRTNFDPRNDESWHEIWEGYCKGSFWNMNSEWHGYDFENPEHEQLFRDVSIELWESGKLHEPRKFGAQPQRLSYYWLDAVLPAAELENNPAVKKAWEQYQIVAGLSKTKHFVKDDF